MEMGHQMVILIAQNHIRMGHERWTNECSDRATGSCLVMVACSRWPKAVPWPNLVKVNM